MQGRRVKRGVATVLGGPPGDVAVVDDLDLPGIRVPRPEERAALGGGVLATELHSVVRECGPEVRAPLAFAVVAVGARVSQDVDSRVPDLDRQRVGVRVRGNAEEPVRAAVAAAPDLHFLPWCAAA